MGGVGSDGAGGGIALVHRGTGIVPSTIGKGIKELRDRGAGACRTEEKRRVRRLGGGRRKKIEEDPSLLGALESFKNNGREYRPIGEPQKVDVHDFKGELGRVSPYGVYNLQDNSGWVSVGVSADTAEFAVATIRRWWHSMGEERYPEASELLITADCGGSNGYRTRLWKLELQQLADELNIPITVCHFPPGTSKWNKIEHRLFSFITLNWRGKPLYTYQTVVNLIAATKTSTGLEVACELDSQAYEKGRKVSDVEMGTIKRRPHQFHGEWNYTIEPRSFRGRI